MSEEMQISSHSEVSLRLFIHLFSGSDSKRIGVLGFCATYSRILAMLIRTDGELNKIEIRQFFVPPLYASVRLAMMVYATGGAAAVNSLYAWMQYSTILQYLLYRYVY